MSKLIVEMEMPSICGECPLCVCLDYSGRGYCKAVLDYYAAVKGNAIWREMELDPNKRPSWCPIKGVLPDEHGDLIDRDESLYDIKRFICNGCNRVTEDDCMTCITKGIQDILCYIKPIIVAERKDDEQIH